MANHFVMANPSDFEDLEMTVNHAYNALATALQISYKYKGTAKNKSHYDSEIEDAYYRLAEALYKKALHLSPPLTKLPSKSTVFIEANMEDYKLRNIILEVAFANAVLQSKKPIIDIALDKVDKKEISWLKEGALSVHRNAKRGHVFNLEKLSIYGHFIGYYEMSTEILNVFSYIRNLPEKIDFGYKPK